MSDETTAAQVAAAPAGDAASQKDGTRAVSGVDVMIITYNESLNLPHCLEALQGWTSRVFVIDSGSTDDTVAIGESFGATVVHHDWPGYAAQKNWGLDNLPFSSEWILIVDADEVITPEVRDRLAAIAARPVDDVVENGFFINRLTYFLNRPIRHCGYFPSWNLRFFKRGTGRYEDRAVHEHLVIANPVGRIREPMLHEDRRGLEHYIAKHNRYSTLEAQALFAEMQGSKTTDQVANVSSETRWNRWIKRVVTPHLPFPALWRFLYMYILRLGILDGRTGFQFCLFIGMYDRMVSLKLREIRREARRSGGRGFSSSNSTITFGAANTRGLAIPEGDDVRSRNVGAPGGRQTQRLPREVTKTDQSTSPRSPARRFPSLTSPRDRVLITGGSGFIGTNLVAYYADAGADVVSLDVRPPQDPAHEALWRDVDLCDDRELTHAMTDFAPTIVHHLAARTDLEEDDDLIGYDANMLGVQNLIGAIEQTSSVKRTVFTSTQLVCRPNHQPRWDTDFCPHTMYGTSKVVTEALIRGWRSPTCEWTIVRPTSIWGPWFHEPYKTFFLAVAKRVYRHPRGFDPIRSFGFVGNTVYQYARLARVPAEQIHERVFYLADYDPVHVREWANLIQREMGIKPLHEIGYTPLTIAAKCGDLLSFLGMQRPLMTSFRLRNLISDNTSDIEPLAAVVGELPYGIEESVRITIDWLAKRGEISVSEDVRERVREFIDDPVVAAP